MRTTTYMILLAAPLALAACNSAEDPSESVEAMMADEMSAANKMSTSDDMPMMTGDGAVRTASAEGIVTAIDDAAGTITIDHGPVPEVDWPAMTMAFSADDDLDEVAAGDRVTFEFQMMDSGSRIVSIAKQ